MNYRESAAVLSSHYFRLEKDYEMFRLTLGEQPTSPTTPGTFCIFALYSGTKAVYVLNEGSELNWLASFIS